MSNRQRHFRRQRWIVLWAVLALLLNQMVVASHFCLHSALAEPIDAVQTLSSHSHPDVTLGAIGSPAPVACSHPASHFDGACMVHCADHAKRAQQVKVLDVSVLPEAHFWHPDALLETAIVPCVRTVDLVRDSGKRRLYEFCTLLI